MRRKFAVQGILRDGGRTTIVGDLDVCAIAGRPLLGDRESNRYITGRWRIVTGADTAVAVVGLAIAVHFAGVAIGASSAASAAVSVRFIAVFYAITKGRCRAAEGGLLPLKVRLT